MSAARIDLCDRVVGMDIHHPRSRARPSNSVLEIQPNNVMALSEKRLALVGEESVSGVTGGTATGLIRSTH
jgi:hypothetical protein